jgi:hypothetical protein
MLMDQLVDQDDLMRAARPVPGVHDLLVRSMCPMTGAGWALVASLNMDGASKMNLLEDHGLPLVQLKEQRRELVVSLSGCSGPLPRDQILQIALLQHTIAAMEAVIIDLDAELEITTPSRPNCLRLVA